MEVSMNKQVMHKSFKNPDQIMTPPNTRVEIVKLGDSKFTKYTFQPGWRWSKDISPLMKTNFDEVSHVAYLISGRLMIKMADGSETELGPDEANTIPAGHDSWVIGNEPAIYLAVETGPAQSV